MGNSPGMMIDPNGEMTKYADAPDAAMNDWLMNSPERMAWLMGGSNSSVGRGGKMFGINQNGDFVMYAGGGGGSSSGFLWGMNKLNYVMDAALEKKFWAQLNEEVKEGGSIRSASVAPGGSIFVTYWYSKNTEFFSVPTIFLGTKTVRVYKAGKYISAREKETNSVWGWVKKHFDIVVGYSESYGVQAGGGIRRGIEARVNFYSTVRTDFEWSFKRGLDPNKGRHEIGDKVNWGVGAAYYGGINYKGENYKGVTEHEISVGAFGIGGAIKFDNSFNVTDWFIGFDPTVNMQLIFGIEGTFKIGFSK